MQETQIWSLVWEDPTCGGATKPVHHNYWTCALEPGSHDSWAHVLQLLKPACPRACALKQEKPPQREAHSLQLEGIPRSLQLEKACTQRPRPSAAKKKKEHYGRQLDLGCLQIPCPKGRLAGWRNPSSEKDHKAGTESSLEEGKLQFISRTGQLHPGKCLLKNSQ